MSPARQRIIEILASHGGGPLCTRDITDCVDPSWKGKINTVRALLLKMEADGQVRSTSGRTRAGRYWGLP